MTYRIDFTPLAREMLFGVEDQRARKLLEKRIDRLADSPHLQGKALSDDLIGYRSVRAVGQRYRILYRVEKERVFVVVVALGRRREGDKKDIYQLAKKLLRAGLLDFD
jgi:mRNA interferase RelE/StbE